MTLNSVSTKPGLAHDPSGRCRHRSFQNQADARQTTFEDIEGFYNRKRLNQALGYRSPENFEREASAS